MSIITRFLGRFTQLIGAVGESPRTTITVADPKMCQGVSRSRGGGAVHFDPVPDKLIELYGVSVGPPDCVHVFKLVCDAGGATSVNMKDLHEFTSVYVNPKLRNMRMGVYIVVAPYPLESPRSKNACVKWAWKQPTKQGWCPRASQHIAHKVWRYIRDARCHVAP